MSYQLMSWASEQTTGSPTRKAVLLALANCANHQTGLCFPSVRHLAAETEMSERTVLRALADLDEAGFIEKQRRSRDDGGNTTTSYTFRVSPPTVTESPPPTDTVAAQNQEEDPKPGGSSTANAVDSQGRTNIADHVVTSTPTERVWKVDRKPVKWEHAKLAMDVLAAWNELTGQELRAQSWLAKIVMRIREYPEATLEDHRYLIERNLAHPWWSGPPTPSVVYGSDAQFERSVVTARQEDEDNRIERIFAAIERSRA